jgi:S-adenosylmethionine-diacylglycerol 3-amino-3-carboxypropyl transferase
MRTLRVSKSTPPSVPYGGRLMFTQSWEDPACDVAALRPQPGATIFAIISGCDNVFGLLLTDPARIIAVDLNPAQVHLFELKRAAFRRLSHAEMLELLGVRAAAARQRLYQKLRGDLSPAALEFWDARPQYFDLGLLTRGGFERYYAMARALLRIVIGGGRLERLFTLCPDEQRQFYVQQWDTWRWRTLLRVVCSKYVLGARLDPTWFAHAETSSFGKHFTLLAEHAVAELPARSNYFLAQILLGRYLDEATVPDYLRPEHFETIRRRLDRISAVTADVGDAVEALEPHSVDCFALSNVFEYSPRELFERTLTALVRAGRPGARFALRNLLAPRRFEGHPEFLVDVDLSARLRNADRGFIYSRFEAATLANAAVD